MTIKNKKESKNYFLNESINEIRWPQKAVHHLLLSKYFVHKFPCVINILFSINYA